jgi:tRNA dimethylallyltransferase
MSRALVAIVGATASGKTAAAVAVARRMPVEVVSADSRQLRAGMRIGTAAPTVEELAAVPHHLVGIVPPDAPFSLAEFLAAAREAIEGIWARGRLPLLVGGTGQYVWALLEGWQPPAIAPNPALRLDLEAVAADAGAPALHARLAALDPAAAARVDARNPRRLVRAIEVALAGGEGAAVPRAVPPDFRWHIVGLEWPRAALHARADARVEAMYAAGLVEEMRGLLDHYSADLPAMRTIGYAEAARVVSGEWDLPAAIERTKIATHRLIRMQAAWFRPDDPRIVWLPGADIEAVAGAVEGAAAALVR